MTFRYIFILFFIVSLYGPRSSAKFLEEQVYPAFDKAVDETSLYLWVGGAAAVLIVQSMDKNIQADWGHHQLMPTWQSNIGDRYISYGGNILIALSQLVLDRHNGVNHARAILFSSGISQAMKLTIHQQRPDQSDDYAFPSGHTTAAFATATSLSYSYGLKGGVPAFAMATLTGLSRISDDKHWASNVVAGAFLGIIWGRATYFEKENEEAPEKLVSRTDFFPTYENGVFAFLFSHDF